MAVISRFEPTLLAVLGLCLASGGCDRARLPEQPQDPRAGYAMCGPSNGVYRTGRGQLKVCAPITDDVVEQVAELSTIEDTELLITSDGGPLGAGMALAKLVRERNWTVRAQRFCLSSCSTYVMAMADRVVVDPYTVVAFHHTGAWTFEATAEHARLPATSPLRSVAREERAAYRDAGRDDRMLDRIAMAVEPTCFQIAQRRSPADPMTRARYDWYVPDRKAAEEIFGDRLSGYWPADAEMATAILRGSLGRPNASVKWGPLPTGEVRPELIGARLPRC